MRTKLISALAVTGLVLAACGGDDGDEDTEAGGASEETTTEAAPDEETTTEADGDGAAAPGGAFVQTADSDLGEILVDAEGVTLYGFTPDTGGVPTCYESCADNWPPLTVEDTNVPEGLDPNLYSVVERDDGSFQLVAGEWPLYYFAGDQAPGDVNGQDIPDWSAVAPDGSLVADNASGGGDDGGSDDDGYDY